MSIEHGDYFTLIIRKDHHARECDGGSDCQEFTPLENIVIDLFTLCRDEGAEVEGFWTIDGVQMDGDEAWLKLRPDLDQLRRAIEVAHRRWRKHS